MPQINPIVQRCKFYERKRQPGESVADFLAQHRVRADKYDFENHLSVALLDRLISSINDNRVQRKLLSEPLKNLTLNKAVDICNAMKLAANNVEHLHTLSATSLSVNARTDRKAIQHKKKLTIIKMSYSHAREIFYVVVMVHVILTIVNTKKPSTIIAVRWVTYKKCVLKSSVIMRSK